MELYYLFIYLTNNLLLYEFVFIFNQLPMPFFLFTFTSFLIYFPIYNFPISSHICSWGPRLYCSVPVELFCAHYSLTTRWGHVESSLLYPYPSFFYFTEENFCGFSSVIESPVSARIRTVLDVSDTPRRNTIRSLTLSRQSNSSNSVTHIHTPWCNTVIIILSYISVHACMYSFLNQPAHVFHDWGFYLNIYSFIIFFIYL